MEGRNYGDSASTSFAAPASFAAPPTYEAPTSFMSPSPSMIDSSHAHLPRMPSYRHQEGPAMLMQPPHMMHSMYSMQANAPISHNTLPQRPNDTVPTSTVMFMGGIQMGQQSHQHQVHRQPMLSLNPQMLPQNQQMTFVPPNQTNNENMPGYAVSYPNQNVSRAFGIQPSKPQFQDSRYRQQYPQQYPQQHQNQYLQQHAGDHMKPTQPRPQPPQSHSQLQPQLQLQSQSQFDFQNGQQTNIHQLSKPVPPQHSQLMHPMYHVNANVRNGYAQNKQTTRFLPTQERLQNTFNTRGLESRGEYQAGLFHSCLELLTPFEHSLQQTTNGVQSFTNTTAQNESVIQAEHRPLDNRGMHMHQSCNVAISTSNSGMVPPPPPPPHAVLQAIRKEEVGTEGTRIEERMPQSNFSNLGGKSSFGTTEAYFPSYVQDTNSHALNKNITSGVMVASVPLARSLSESSNFSHLDVGFSAEGLSQQQVALNRSEDGMHLSNVQQERMKPLSLTTAASFPGQDKQKIAAANDLGKVWQGEFWVAAKSNPKAAYEGGLKMLAHVPSTLQARMCLDLAELARRHHRTQQARILYQAAIHLNPTSAQAYIEYARMEEDAGELSRSLHALEMALQRCEPQETLLIKALKQYERSGDFKGARSVLARVSEVELEKTRRVLVEGALLEARAGSEKTARRVFKYLIQHAGWYGPIYIEAARFEENRDCLTQADNIVKAGLAECPKFGPLWITALRLQFRITAKSLVEANNLAQSAANAQVLSPDPCPYLSFSQKRDLCSQLRRFSDKTVNLVGSEFLWKVLLGRAQIETAMGCFSKARKFIAKALRECPQGQRWMCWAAGAQTEVAFTFQKLRILAYASSFSTKSNTEKQLLRNSQREFRSNQASSLIELESRSEVAKSNYGGAGSKLRVVVDDTNHDGSVHLQAPHTFDSHSLRNNKPGYEFDTNAEAFVPTVANPSTKYLSVESLPYCPSPAQFMFEGDQIYTMHLEENALSTDSTLHYQAHYFAQQYSHTPQGSRFTGTSRASPTYSTKSKASTVTSIDERSIVAEDEIKDSFIPELTLETLSSTIVRIAGALKVALDALTHARETAPSKHAAVVLVENARVAEIVGPISESLYAIVGSYPSTLKERLSQLRSELTQFISAHSTLCDQKAKSQCYPRMWEDLVKQSEEDLNELKDETSSYEASLKEIYKAFKVSSDTIGANMTPNLMDVRELVLATASRESLLEIAEPLTGCKDTVSELEKIRLSTEQFLKQQDTYLTSYGAFGGDAKSKVPCNDEEWNSLIDSASEMTCDEEMNENLADSVEESNTPSSESLNAKIALLSLFPLDNSIMLTHPSLSQDPSHDGPKYISGLRFASQRSARVLLNQARDDPGADWKTRVELLFFELRAGRRHAAMREAEDALIRYPGTGRLWALLVWLRQNDGPNAQLEAFARAIQETPKSGEVWSEGAKLCLNPTHSGFNLKMAAQLLRFALHFTPQYGDSFIELLRAQLLVEVTADRESVMRTSRICVNTDPNYGLQWSAACRAFGPTLVNTVSGTFSKAASRVGSELKVFQSLYQRAIARSLCKNKSHKDDCYDADTNVQNDKDMSLLISPSASSSASVKCLDSDLAYVEVGAPKKLSFTEEALAGVVEIASSLVDGLGSRSESSVRHARRLSSLGNLSAVRDARGGLDLNTSMFAVNEEADNSKAGGRSRSRLSLLKSAEKELSVTDSSTKPLSEGSFALASSPSAIRKLGDAFTPSVKNGRKSLGCLPDGTTSAQRLRLSSSRKGTASVSRVTMNIAALAAAATSSNGCGGGDSRVRRGTLFEDFNDEEHLLNDIEALDVCQGLDNAYQGITSLMDDNYVDECGDDCDDCDDEDCEEEFRDDFSEDNEVEASVSRDDGEGDGDKLAVADIECEFGQEKSPSTNKCSKHVERVVDTSILECDNSLFEGIDEERDEDLISEPIDECASPSGSQFSGTKLSRYQDSVSKKSDNSLGAVSRSASSHRGSEESSGNTSLSSNSLPKVMAPLPILVVPPSSAVPLIIASSSSASPKSIRNGCELGSNEDETEDTNCFDSVNRAVEVIGHKRDRKLEIDLKRQPQSSSKAEPNMKRWNVDAKAALVQALWMTDSAEYTSSNDLPSDSELRSLCESNLDDDLKFALSTAFENSDIIDSFASNKPEKHDAVLDDLEKSLAKLEISYPANASQEDIAERKMRMSRSKHQADAFVDEVDEVARGMMSIQSIDERCVQQNEQLHADLSKERTTSKQRIKELKTLWNLWNINSVSRYMQFASFEYLQKYTDSDPLEHTPKTLEQEKGSHADMQYGSESQSDSSSKAFTQLLTKLNNGLEKYSSHLFTCDSVLW